MNLTGCYEITDKRLVTYHVTFEADGTKYNVETSFFLYHTRNISYETFFADYSKADIDGRLKDGSKYEIHVTNIPNSLYSNANAHSEIFVQISPNTVESFDQNHFKSPHHVIDIQKTYFDVGNPEKSYYKTAEVAHRAYLSSVKYSHYYYTVGAQVTEFSNINDASSRFSPAKIDSRNDSDSDTTYDGHTFNVSFPQSGKVGIWVLDPGIVREDTNVWKGSEPDSVVKLNNFEATIPNGIGYMFYLDPKLKKVIFLFEDHVFLHFDNPVNPAQYPRSASRIHTIASAP